MKKTVISISPAVKRFNAAVERADKLLPWADQLDVAQLVKALTFAGWQRPQSWSDAANELEASHRALNDSKP